MKIKNLIIATALAASTVGVFASPNLPAVPQSNLTPSHLVGPGLGQIYTFNMDISQPGSGSYYPNKAIVDTVTFEPGGVRFSIKGMTINNIISSVGPLTVKFAKLHKVNICGIPDRDTCMGVSNINGFLGTKTGIIQLTSNGTVVKTIDVADYSNDIYLSDLDGPLKHERHHYQIK